MKSYALESRTKDCKNCYKCIRYCPVKSISFADNKASIVHEDCILCGRCYLVCPQHLKIVRDDLDVVKSLLASGEKVIISLAPSFVADFDGVSLKTFKDAMQKLGFFDVEETAIGATIVKKAYDEMLEENHDVIISSCCHSVNLLIQKHYPGALKYLANVLSPMLAHGKDIKARYGKSTKVVFVGPCISKKDEADRNPDYIDAVLTYPELNKFLEEKGITIEKDNVFDNVKESKARFFPTCGGVLKTMECKNKEFQYIAIDGEEKVKDAIEDILSGKIHKCFIEMSLCHGSCINGPMVNKDKNSYVASFAKINKFAGDKDFNKSIISSDDITRSYNQISVLHARPSDNEIEDMLTKMGKQDPKNRLNCGSCGYNSCVDKAIAIIQGKAIIDMCLPALIDKAESFSHNIVTNSPNGILVADESFNIQLINKAMCRILGLSEQKFAIHANVSSFLDCEDFVRALNGEKVLGKKVYLNEYDKYVETMMIYDEKHHIIICIMRDITKQVVDNQKHDEILQKSIGIADKIVEKHMMTVQEIASLLGESAAETKVALNNLKNTLKDDNK